MRVGWSPESVGGKGLWGGARRGTLPDVWPTGPIVMHPEMGTSTFYGGGLVKTSTTQASTASLRLSTCPSTHTSGRSPIPTAAHSGTGRPLQSPLIVLILLPLHTCLASAQSFGETPGQARPTAVRSLSATVAAPGATHADGTVPRGRYRPSFFSCRSFRGRSGRRRLGLHARTGHSAVAVDRRGHRCRRGGSRRRFGSFLDQVSRWRPTL